MTGMARKAAPPAILLLVLLAAIQPYALSVVTPSLPELARALGTDYGTISLTLSLYLFAVAFAQILAGPLSDRYGRRIVILTALAIYGLGGVLAALSVNVTMLIGARALQGAASGSVFALTRAVIRDTSERSEAASRIGYVMTIMIVVPMFSPILGGLIDKHFGWPAIFWSIGGLGAIIFAVTYVLLAETHLDRKQDAPLSETFASMPLLLRQGSFRGYVLIMFSTGSLFFSFLGVSPYIVVDYMGHKPEVYANWFIVVAGGYMVGNFLVGRFVDRIGLEAMMTLGTALSLGGALALVSSLWVFGWVPAALFLPMILCSAGNGLTVPTAAAAAVSVRPEFAGAAAGLSGGMQLAAGATVSALTSYAIIWSPWALPLTILASTVIGVAANVMTARAHNERRVP